MQNHIILRNIHNRNNFTKPIKHQVQTDDIDEEFSKVFTEYIKNIQHQNSQRANSMFTNDVFSIIYSYLSILELKKTTRRFTNSIRHTTVRQEINIKIFKYNT